MRSGRWFVCPSYVSVQRRDPSGRYRSPQDDARGETNLQFILRRLFGQREVAHAAEEGVVFLTGADGDADFVGQAGLVEVADEDALGLEAEVGVAAAAVGDAGEDEVGFAGQDG